MEESQIYLSPPDVGKLEKKKVISAINSGWVAPMGPEVDAFESEIANYCGRNYGVALSSGTAALHLSLLGLKLAPGDFVLCSTMTFVATANAVMYVGGIPVLIDSDVSTGNISLGLLASALLELSSSGRKIGAVISVDFLGKAADHSEIGMLCESFGVPLLIDAAESLGATHRGAPSASFGKAAVVSFNGNKIMTTSGGGMFLTDDEHLALRVRHLSTQARESATHYEHKEVGYNYRMSNLLAAVGRAQLGRLPKMISKRRSIREKYRALFLEVPGVTVFGGPATEDNCWLTSILVDEACSGWHPQELGDHLKQDYIESRPLWKPMHLQPLYDSYPSYIDGSSEKIFTQGLALPSGSNQDTRQWTRISDSINTFISKKLA